MIQVTEVQTEREYQLAADLFREYVSQLGVDLSFQDLDKELENIAREYSRPSGILFIAYRDNKTPLGCVGIRKLQNSICELKRMYVRNEARGLGLGRLLLRKAMEAGKELGYTKMRLDTLPTMQPAISLYTKEGFYEIGPYRYNPISGTKYMEVDLYR